MSNDKNRISIIHTFFTVLITLIVVFVVADLWSFSPYRYQIVNSGPTMIYRLNKETGEVAFIRFAGGRLHVVSTE